nr:hypothetical protein [Nanoarchaeota archaeon]
MKKLSKKISIGIGLTIIMAFAFLAFTNIIEGEDSSITTYLGEQTKIASLLPPLKLILEKTRSTSNALFDIILTIPEKSKRISPGENLLISIELINFGGPGKTDVSISYIITNDEGDVVLIEHESRVVETQTSFLKEIDLPALKYGVHKVLVELLYSNTSAVATGEFRANLY